jgi:hypothetical protein
MVDASYKPLLYGPYVIFRSIVTGIELCMILHLTKSKRSKSKFLSKQVIIVSIKNANWRYWTVVLKSPKGEVEEFILFAGRLAHEGSNRLFLIETCIDCGKNASNLCGNYFNVGFCQAHSKNKNVSAYVYIK